MRAPVTLTAMKRSKVIRLVLLGGGVATMLAACGDDRARREACEEARRQLRPDAEELCRRSTTSSRSYFGPSWFAGRSRTDTGSGIVSGTSQRSGFGSSARSSGS